MTTLSASMKENARKSSCRGERGKVRKLARARIGSEFKALKDKGYNRKDILASIMPLAKVKTKKAKKCGVKAAEKKKH